MKKDFIIHTKMIDVAVWLFEKANTFPKKQRFVLGQKIENSALVCLRLIVEANEIKTESAVLEKLDELNIELCVLRDLLRMAYEVNFIKATSLEYIIQQIDEVGKMCGGWIKRYKNSSSSKRLS